MFNWKQIQPQPLALIITRQYKTKDDWIVCQWRWLVRKWTTDVVMKYYRNWKNQELGGKELFKKLFKIKIQSQGKVRPDKTCKENQHKFWFKKETETKCYSILARWSTITIETHEQKLLVIHVWRHCANEEPLQRTGGSTWWKTTTAKGPFQKCPGP